VRCRRRGSPYRRKAVAGGCRSHRVSSPCQCRISGRSVAVPPYQRKLRGRGTEVLGWGPAAERRRRPTPRQDLGRQGESFRRECRSLEWEAEERRSLMDSAEERRSLADRTAAFSKAAFPEVNRLRFQSGEGDARDPRAPPSFSGHRRNRRASGFIHRPYPPNVQDGESTANAGRSARTRLFRSLKERAWHRAFLFLFFLSFLSIRCEAPFKRRMAARFAQEPLRVGRAQTGGEAAPETSVLSRLSPENEPI
jgi:hypothetical protein